MQTASVVRAGGSTPEEEVEAAIARAGAANGRLNAIVEPTYERARADAAEAPTDGPLAGVPILLKDLFCPREGDPAYQGNRALAEADHRYRGTGAVARRLMEAGAISIGRSHSPEMGCGQCPAAAETELYGPTRNPWNTDRSPLGSSGGAAAAVAAGVVAIAHATDGGGSIRMPASANGLVGLKPSRGRISNAPVGEGWGGGITDGVVTRTVADTALAMDVLSGHEIGDPYWVAPPTTSFSAELPVAPSALRIGVCTSVPYVDTHAECAAGARAAADLLSDLGHEVFDAQPSSLDGIGYLHDYIRIVRVSLAVEMAEFESALGRPFTIDDVEEGTWINRQRGLKVSAVDYAASRERLHAFTRETVAWWHAGHDLLLTPTVAVPPPPTGHLVDGDERTLIDRLVPITAFTPQFNVTGQPAISLPLAMSSDGLPIGVQLVAAPGRDALLLRMAAQLEQAAPWDGRRPEVWVGEQSAD